MKIVLVLLLEAILGVLAQQDCKTAEPNESCTAIRRNVDGEISWQEINSTSCINHTHCCVYGDKCVPKMKEENKSTIRDDYYEEAGKITAKAKDDDDARFLQTSQLPNPCIPPPQFPAKCRPQRNEPYVLTPPHNIPYCVRIPCDPSDNSVYEKSNRMCGMQPGCYFDKELFEYREAFGDDILPGVPVCHLAIRNRIFQNKAQEVVKSYGAWNPYFTKCLLDEIDSEIRKGPVGCELLKIIETFHVTPKLAGWSTINSYHCALIDGCWREGRGCFYPVDISDVRVKSGQRNPSLKTEIVFGRPKCQHFDKSSPLNIVKSYHRCLSAGCSVDSYITDNYYSYLFSIGKSFTLGKQWEYWGDVEKGLVGPYNIDEAYKRYGPPITSTTSQDVVRCGHAFGGGPCGPSPPKPHRPNTYCPYKSFFVPRFPTLQGSFEGCCEINFCYLHKSEISNMHSGTAHYYTEWSQWSTCSVTCGTGRQKKSRKCISQDISKCTDSLIDSKSCTTGRPCAHWTHWTSYTQCEATCFPGGFQSRRRVCKPSSGYCPGPREQIRDCNKHLCDRFHSAPGIWTTWSPLPCEYDRHKKECVNARVRQCMYCNIPVGSCIGPAEEKSLYACFGCP